jgi:CRP/FNR family transcriptional regulator, cyclic AMP receptor protein
MRGPYGFEVSDTCQTCKHRATNFFCQLPAAALKDFNAIKSSSVYPEGAMLFLEKQEPRGIFILCEGQVKLSISSAEGKTLILQIAKAGEVLGLMAALAGTSYEVTAETLRPCQVAFVRRDDFLRFLAQHSETNAGVVRQLAAQYQFACEQLRTVGLAASAHEKLAKLLLDWTAEGSGAKDGRVTVPLTHEEIAEFIGSSRETVTRTFSEFKSQRLVTLKGSTLTIANRAGLQDLVGV